MKMAFITLLRKLKNIENDEIYMSNNKVNDAVLVMKMGCPRHVSVKEGSPNMIRSVHRHRSMIIDLINDAILVLNFAMNERSNQNDINYNFKTPLLDTVKTIPIFHA